MKETAIYKSVVAISNLKQEGKLGWNARKHSNELHLIGSLTLSLYIRNEFVVLFLFFYFFFWLFSRNQIFTFSLEKFFILLFFKKKNKHKRKLKKKKKKETK